MTLSQRVRFLLWFARRDLFARSVLRTTLVILITVAALVGFALTALGLARGHERVRLHRLGRHSQICLWVGEPASPWSRKFDAASLNDLRAAVPAALPRAEDFRGGFPFLELEILWLTAAPGGAGEAEAHYLTGRTILPDDPLFDNPQSLEWGTPFDTSKREGVLVTRAMLERLKVPPQTRPQELSFRSKVSGKPVAVPVAGLIRENLALGHQFVLTEEYRRDLLARDPDPPLRAIYTGPVGPGWPSPRKLREAVQQELLEKFKLELPRVSELEDEKGNVRKVWRLDSIRKPAPLKSTWRIDLESIRALLAAHGLRCGDEFLHLEPTHQPDPGQPPPEEGYPWVGVWTRDLPHLPPAAEVIRARGFPVANEDFAQQIQGVTRAALAALTVLSLVLICVGVLAAWNMHAIQELRTQQKRAEIGMLKAIGLSNGWMVAVYVTEAFLIWLGAFAGGWLLGWAGGQAAAWYVAEEEQERALAFVWSWPSFALVLGVSLLVCVLTMLVATYVAWRKPPIKTLNAQ